MHLFSTSAGDNCATGKQIQQRVGHTKNLSGENGYWQCPKCWLTYLWGKN